MKNNPSAITGRPRRILVRGVNWLGDAVMTTPALLRLREFFPAAHITQLCPEKLRDLWLHHLALNEVMTFGPDEGVLAIAQKLRAGKFDLAVVLPNSPRSALEVFCAGIPRRTGYARPWRNFFLTQAVADRPAAAKMRKRTVGEVKSLIANPPQPAPRGIYPASAHQTHEYSHLVAALGANPQPFAPQLMITPGEVQAALEKFGLATIAQPVFGLNPGAEYGPAKRWPVEKFIAAANEIQKRTHCAWLIFGGKNDAELADVIAKGIVPDASRPAPLNLAGKTSLRELMALLKACRVLLTNDTGPMHIAAALGTPVVVPFGSTSPELTGPVSDGGLEHQIIKSDAPCSPCFLRECPVDFRCMNGIEVERVTAAVLQSVRPSPVQHPK